MKGHLTSFVSKKRPPELITPTTTARCTAKDKQWNRTIAIHAMHLLEYKKKQFNNFLKNASSVDPCSIRHKATKALNIPRQEYLNLLLTKSSEELILLWTNTKLSNWIEQNRNSKIFAKLSNLIGDENKLHVTNFSKDCSANPACLTIAANCAIFNGSSNNVNPFNPTPDCDSDLLFIRE